MMFNCDHATFSPPSGDERPTPATAYLFMAQSSSAARIIICLVVSIMPVVAAVFVVTKWGQNKKETTDHGIELQPLMVGGDGERLMTGREKIIYLDNAKAKLDEELQKTEKELKHVKQVIKTLMNQKKDLKNQTEKLISLLQQDKTQMEECERKLWETPIFYQEYNRQMRQKIKQDVERRKREHDELLQNTQKLLETTEQMITQMSERKGKLERDKEQINKNLKVTERRREEVQRKLESEREEEIKEEIKDTVSNDPS